MNERHGFLSTQTTSILVLVVFLSGCTASTPVVETATRSKVAVEPVPVEIATAALPSSVLPTQLPTKLPTLAPKLPTELPSAPALLQRTDDHRIIPIHQATGTALVAWQSKHFVLLVDSEINQLSEIAHLLENTHRSFHEMFPASATLSDKSTDPLVWVFLNSRETYEQYAQWADNRSMSWTQAYYSPFTNRVAICVAAKTTASSSPSDPATEASLAEPQSSQWLAVALKTDAQLCAQITHEAGHQLAFNSGLQARGVMYPIWASEGLATNFELDANGRLGTQASNPLRLRHLVRSIENNQLLPLKQWVNFTRLPLNNPKQINAIYAQSWAFFRFLHIHRRTELMTYLTLMANQNPGRRSDDALMSDFVGVFGDLDKLEKDWLVFVKDMTASN